jgi:hypothetical protein
MRLQRLGATGKSRRGNRLRTYDQLREALRQAGVSMGPWFGPRAEEVLPTVADSVQFVLESDGEVDLQKLRLCLGPPTQRHDGNGRCA